MPHSAVEIADWDIPPGMTWLTSGDPVRTELTADVSVTDEFQIIQETWAYDPIVGGEPPIIIGHECNLQWHTEYEYQTWLWTVAPTGLTIPADVGGEPVVAVALYLTFAPRWERSLSGGPTGSHKYPAEPPCKSESDNNAPPYGDTLFECLVDDTQVAHIAGTPSSLSDSLPNNIDSAYVAHLILDDTELDYDPAPPQWVVGREPFDPHPLAGSSAGDSVGYNHWLFWGPHIAGHAFPDEISLAFSHTNIRTSNIRVPGTHDPGPYGGAQPPTILTETIAWVDVYPFYWYGAGDANLMMVV